MSTQHAAHDMRRNFILFVSGVICLSIAGGAFNAAFNNYLNDVFHTTAQQRGNIEFPREFPGFLTALFAGVLFFLSETRVAACASVAVGAGMIGLACCGSHYTSMLCLLFLWSTGLHLLMPLGASISMELAQGRNQGRMLGRIASIGNGASIAGCGIAWLIMRFSPANYPLTFAVGAGFALCAAVVQFSMRMPSAHLDRPKFVFRPGYVVYYLLALLFGARKQIFITFGPLVLIKLFNRSASTMALLMIAGSALCMLFQPLVGKTIDRLGERVVIMAASACLVVVCAGYGYADRIGNATWALRLLYVCFVSDQMLFAANMAHTTYLSKIAERPSHISPTLSLGTSIDHVVSILIAVSGGWLWEKCGHGAVFAAAAAIALVTIAVGALVRTSDRRQV